LIAVDELDIQYLVSYIQKYFIKCREEFLRQNPVGILEIIYQGELFTEILIYCLETICKEPERLFNSDDLIKLKAPLLELLLKRDDLKLDEIIIWESLLKWGIAQNPSISQDNTKWSKEELTIMKRTLHRYFPLIRFPYISSEDFVDKVYPLKKLLPEHLIDNLVVFYVAPSRKSNFIKIRPPRKSYTSTIIEPLHFAIFSSWIDKKSELYYNAKDMPYNFNLLYRANRDGYTAAVFHEKCDGKGATIIIAKIEDSEQIVGGYNPLDWDLNDLWKSTKDSFIFSFKNRMMIQTAKVGYSNGDQHSIGCYSNYGPTFGGKDLAICENNSNYWTSKPMSYPKIDIPKLFYAEEYEVFQVAKKSF